MADEKRDTQSMGRKTPVVQGYQLRYSSQSGVDARGQWFGPLAPLAPVAPPDVKGRILDYASGYNTQQKPRPYEGVSFDQLRAFADSYDLLRLIIETRKDQLGRMKWNIVPRDYVNQESEGDSALDARCLEIEKFFIRPDKENFWDEWLRMILEDLFVLDAPAIYRRKTNGGDLYALQPIDGGTIKRVIDDHGGTPLPPDPAYQQVLKGMAAVDYTTDELLYRPRNKRTHKVFGYSPVEQIIMTINIGLRRQVWQLQTFTEGNMPEALIGTPDDWTPDQVRQFQEWFDSMLQGNTAERRRAKFVPGEVGKSFITTKPDEIFGHAEDWLARVCCYAFSVPPTPFIKQMNRATAETAQETAIEEGLVPIQKWVKNLIDTVIIENFGEEDLEFKWADEDELDPAIKAQIDNSDLGSGRRTFNEVRAAAGLDAIDHPNADRPMSICATTGVYTPIFKTPEEEQAEKDAADAANLAQQTAAGGGDDGSDGPPGGSGGASPGQDDHLKHKTADDEVQHLVSADQEVAPKAVKVIVAVAPPTVVRGLRKYMM